MDTGKKQHGFTLIQIVMVLVVIGILASIVMVRQVSLRYEAVNARAEKNIGALRSAMVMYYVKTALSQYDHLCTATGNPYREITVSSPCYPATYEELESLLASPLNWSEGEGACYSAETGAVTACN